MTRSASKSAAYRALSVGQMRPPITGSIAPAATAAAAWTGAVLRAETGLSSGFRLGNARSRSRGDEDKKHDGAVRERSTGPDERRSMKLPAPTPSSERQAAALVANSDMANGVDQSATVPVRGVERDAKNEPAFGLPGRRSLGHDGARTGPRSADVDEEHAGNNDEADENEVTLR